MNPSAQPTAEVQSARVPEHEVSPLILNRWSPRSFLERDIPEEDLLALFEAARWAPSASNEQSWRFILARKPEDRAIFYEFINPSNRVWCEKAPALALVLSKKTNAQGQFHAFHAFDTGTATGLLALEATRRGLNTHSMGGFDRDKARSILGISDEFDLHSVIAIGYRGPKEVLPEALQAREQPSTRRPLSEILFEGKM
ncbi:nitroreductase family protein [Paenibacillus allorhizosphaerae]|uniref:Malonic semialdehyde reductase RutE n=1 Tax=Paenibacillus allorhizosphaerae TaxID=2849866 RepID=A0ABM8VL79_9BACL|nr:nitroreductase family protein [Paenibacillus allorhizosphaerae]CAG7648239.1 malonic semialdehyde reductase RutE [Paenibacillus allorhizosphaerae]